MEACREGPLLGGPPGTLDVFKGLQDPCVLAAPRYLKILMRPAAQGCSPEEGIVQFTLPVVGHNPSLGNTGLGDS